MNEDARPLLTIPLGLGPAARPSLKMLAERARTVLAHALTADQTFGLKLPDAADMPMGIIGEDFYLFIFAPPQIQMRLPLNPVGRRSSVVKDRADEREELETRFARAVARNAEFSNEVAEILNHSDNVDRDLATLSRQKHIFAQGALSFHARNQLPLNIMTVEGEVSFDHPGVRKKFLAGESLVQVEAVHWDPIGMKLSCLIVTVESERHHRMPKVGSQVHLQLGEKDAWIAVVMAGARAWNIPIKLELVACVSSHTMQTVGYEIADATALHQVAIAVGLLLSR